MRRKYLAIALIALTGIGLALAAVSTSVASVFPDFGGTSATVEADDEVESHLKADLVAPGSADTAARGSVEFEELGGDESSMVVIVETPDLEGWLLDVSVNGINLEEPLKVDASGRGELRLDTRDDDTVPAIRSGDEIVLRAGAANDVILSGTVE